MDDKTLTKNAIYILENVVQAEELFKKIYKASVKKDHIDSDTLFALQDYVDAVLEEIKMLKQKLEWIAPQEVIPQYNAKKDQYLMEKMDKK